MTGQSLKSFIVSNSLKVAQGVLQEYRASELSLADSEKFLRLLEHQAGPPAEVTASLPVRDTVSSA